MFGVGGDVVTITDDMTDIPEGLEVGKTYIKVNIGAGGEPFYIPVDKLIEYVKGSVGETTTVVVDETTHVVTVTINDGAIVNKMIADGTIAKTKLAQAVQDSLDKADSAVQSVSEGTVAGAVDVDGTSVPVHGLANADLNSNAGAGFKGASSNWEWIDTYLSLLSEIQVYGSNVFSSSFYDTGCDNLQLPLFALDPTAKVCGKNTTTDGNGDGGRQWYWLRNVASASDFAYVSGHGNSDCNNASGSLGVRPLFCIG